MPPTSMDNEKIDLGKSRRKVEIGKPEVPKRPSSADRRDEKKNAARRRSPSMPRDLEDAAQAFEGTDFAVKVYPAYATTKARRCWVTFKGRRVGVCRETNVFYLQLHIATLDEEVEVPVGSVAEIDDKMTPSQLREWCRQRRMDEEKIRKRIDSFTRAVWFGYRNQGGTRCAQRPLGCPGRTTH